MRLAKFSSGETTIHVNPEQVAFLQGGVGSPSPTLIHFAGGMRYSVDQSLSEVTRALEG